MTLLVMSISEASWCTAGMSLYQVGDYSVSLNRFFLTCVVRERQLRLYGHESRYPETNPTHPLVSIRDPDSQRPRGRPQNLWLEEGDASCHEVLGMRCKVSKRP